MSSLLGSVLTTPLLKVPVLLTCGVLSYVNINPPRDAPQEDERKTRDETDLMARGLPFKMHLLRLYGVSMYLETYRNWLSIS